MSRDTGYLPEIGVASGFRPSTLGLCPAMCGLARSLLEKKRSFVTGKAEVSNGQKIDCWRGLYSSHAERYANVAGLE